MRAGARQALPAGLVRAQPLRDTARVLGSDQGAVRAVRLLVVQGDRRPGVQRPGRRLADLRQRAAAQGRALVRARRRGHGRRRARGVLAGHPRAARPALRPGRGDDRPAVLSVRPRALLEDPEDARVRGGRRRQRPGGVPAPAGGHLRQRRRRPGARRAHPRAAPQPARAHALHLPALRRVRRGLQLRRQEHARLQLPHRGGAGRRRAAHPCRRALARPAARRRVGRALRRLLVDVRRRRHRPLRPGARIAGGDRRPRRAGRGHPRHRAPPAAQPVGGAAHQQAAARDAVLRQRRPADLRAQLLRGLGLRAPPAGWSIRASGP